MSSRSHRSCQLNRTLFFKHHNIR